MLKENAVGKSSYIVLEVGQGSRTLLPQDKSRLTQLAQETYRAQTPELVFSSLYFYHAEVSPLKVLPIGPISPRCARIRGVTSVRTELYDIVG